MADILKCGLLVELQKLFGTDLRPGTAASYLGGWTPTNLEWMFIQGKQSEEDPGVLLFTVSKDGGISFNPQPASALPGYAKAEGVLLAINVDVIMRRLRSALGDVK